MFSDTVKQAAAGQWDILLQNLAGLSEPETTPTKVGMPCPNCGGHDRYEFKSVNDGYHLCRGCGAGDGWSMLMKRLGVDFSECLNQVAQYLGLKKDEIDTTTTKTCTTGTRRDTRHHDDGYHHSSIAGKAHNIWQSSAPARPDHPYLVRKKLPPIKLKQYKDSLVSAVYDTGYQLVNLQFIGCDGQKRFLKGGQTKNGFQWWLPHWGSSSWTVYLCEGVADALATYCQFEQCRMVIAAYSVSNLISLAPFFRQQLRDSRLIAVMDNDEPTQSRPWRPGASVLMAHRCFDEVLIPPLGMDASDMWVKSHG
ncbi:primase-helicase zinc-binding domain-containing protein [Endozoicomonas sp. 4G]|uniref:primase-helicase zinc-binding domain-containing protein n=1 Tax=Endozoicomonas sp. 4G TaxID=2872754 RepID=UPI002078F915|nr:primase-helicase zinc-binding domain-containing protein [Endozoicomonas sp. 4G]